MSSSTRFIPHIYHNWENMKINNFNILITKEIEKNFCMCDFAFINCHMCTKGTPKRPIIKNRHTIIACQNQIWHVWAHACHIAWHSWTGLAVLSTVFQSTLY